MIESWVRNYDATHRGPVSAALPHDLTKAADGLTVEAPADWIQLPDGAGSSATITNGAGEALILTATAGINTWRVKATAITACSGNVRAGTGQPPDQITESAASATAAASSATAAASSATAAAASATTAAAAGPRVASFVIDHADWSGLGAGVKTHDYTLVVPANVRILDFAVAEGFVGFDDPAHGTYSVKIGTTAGGAEIAASLDISVGQTGFPQQFTRGIGALQNGIGIGGDTVTVRATSSVDLNTATAGHVRIVIPTYTAA